MNKEQIIDLADKLYIGLSDEEATTILNEFDIIDKNIDQINEINDIKEYREAYMPFDLYKASLREDEPKESVKIDDILRNAKDIDGREIRVPKVVS